MDKLINRSIVDLVWQNSRLLCLIESIKRKKLIGFKYNNWINLGFLAINCYQRYWDYIKLAFKKYKLWATLIQSDRKWTFHKKLTAFYETMPFKDYSVD